MQSSTEPSVLFRVSLPVEVNPPKALTLSIKVFPLEYTVKAPSICTDRSDKGVHSRVISVVALDGYNTSCINQNGAFEVESLRKWESVRILTSCEP